MYLQFQLIPARGRKRQAVRDFLQSFLVSTYPREGTETFFDAIHFSRKVRVSTYPREGTETGGNACHCKAKNRFNLSPRGDGNFLLQKGVLGGKAFLLQLIPARGQ